MDLENSFVVPAGIDQAWRTLLDVEKIAPCMPGAALTEVNGDEFNGTVKVKLGPVTMTYGGKASFLSKDDQAHVAVIEGVGKETRGSGTAKALVTTALHEIGPNETRVDVTTDLAITGKPAQFGRGVMQDVASRLVTQFADNLSAVMAQSEAPVTPAGASEPGAPAAVSAPSQPRVQEVEAIDLLGTAGMPVLKRAAPFAIGAVIVAVIAWIILRRR